MNWNNFWLGCLGGLVSELIRAKKALDDGKSWNANVWVGLGIAVILGGIAGLLSKSTELLVVIGAGYTAPAFLTGLLGKRDDASKGLAPGASSSSGPTSVRDWWSY